MKIGIVANAYEHSKQVANQLEKKLRHSGFQIDHHYPDIVITIGGDGTLLYAFHQYEDQLDHIRFIGIHTGHLGFYTDWRDYELDSLVESLCNDHGESVDYPLIDVYVTFKGKKDVLFYHTLNESTIRRINNTLVADVMVGQQVFERFRGDGLAIATPTGSTGYNKSIGGAVMSPQVEAMQLSEMASINNRVFRTLGSPIVVNKNEWIHLILENDKDYILTVDQHTYHLNGIRDIYYTVSNQKVRFAKYRHTNFWRRVRDAFIEDES